MPQTGAKTYGNASYAGYILQGNFNWKEPFLKYLYHLIHTRCSLFIASRIVSPRRPAQGLITLQFISRVECKMTVLYSTYQNSTEKQSLRLFGIVIDRGPLPWI